MSENKERIHKLREVLRRDEQKLNPTNGQKEDTLKLSKEKKVDSLKNKTSHLVDSLNSIELSKKLSHKEDNLQSILNSPVNKIEQTVTGMNGHIQHKEDSIESRITNLNNKLTAFPQRVHNKPDSVENKINDLNKKIGNVDNKIQTKADSITATENKLENKLSKASGEKLNIPGANLNADDLKSEGKIPDLKIKDLGLPSSSIIQDTKLPELNTDDVTKNLGTEIPKVDNVDVSKGLPSMKEGLSDISVPKTDKLDKVKDLSGDVNKLDGKLGEAEKYGDEVSKLKKADANQIEKQAEEKSKNISEVKGLNAEITEAQKTQAEQEALIKKYRDKKALQEEVKRKAGSVANDYISQHTVEIKNAQAKLAKSKKGLSSVKSFNDLFKRKSDELVGKKFYQRLVPGITTQIYQPGKIAYVDAGIQLGYRLSPRLTTGLGGLYRIGVNKDFRYYVQSGGVYGGRFYADLTAYKGIFVHGEFEMLKLNPARMATIQTKEAISSQVYGSYFGLGKKISVSRRVRASVIGLYRVEYEGKLPSMRKLNMRLGFDYLIGKKKRVIGAK